ncbi:universal stress protein [Streptomyces purpureus]|uniref:Universal stress protein n=1 Tax=Streptomyces purpureus TaxID=1951 RepID=A0A918GWD8_9ACTN|nr:universal stress protein [Streptomyces purpureus]GGT14859.1 universal stress protein [Streptomyces purpureus]
MTRTVTAGVDTSEESLAAAEWAADEAARRGLPLRLVHVWDWQPQLFGVPATAESHQQDADRVLRRAVERVRQARPGFEPETVRLEGAPAEVLAREAERAEVLVLGSRGLGAIAGFLVGSVSLATLARAERPVVLVRAPGDVEAVPARGRGGDVVLGLDVADVSEEVVTYAFEAAARQGGALRVVHGVLPPPVLGDFSAADDAAVRTELLSAARLTLTQVLAPWREKYPGTTVGETVEVGSSTRMLLDASAGASLLVVGRRIPRTALGTRIGSVTHAVLHHSPVPVAVVPHH